MDLTESYSVLGLDPDLTYTSTDVRRIYKELALKCHPDKSHKEADNQRFIKLKDAYDVVIYAIEFPSVHHAALLLTMIHIMQMANIHKVEQSRSSNHVRPTVIRYETSLESVYNEEVIVIPYPIKTYDGRFRVDKAVVNLADMKDTYTFKSGGDFIDENTRKDLVLHLSTKSHPDFKVDSVVCPHDLMMDFPIDLYNYYCRKQWIISVFGRLVDISYEPGLMVKRIPDAGLPFRTDTGISMRGDLYIYFNLVLPSMEEPHLPDFERCLKEYFIVNH